jgi:hypothetical protein
MAIDFPTSPSPNQVNRTLNSTEYASVESYLSSKYGL